VSELHEPNLENSPQNRQFQCYHDGVFGFHNTGPTGNALMIMFGRGLLRLVEIAD
jgi:hypothetical protein